uniref:Uncharacterized protein n=1 Tax=Anguilla anguilla TaxID=7936 RepID=A0A0E9V5C3_ANGAN
MSTYVALIWPRGAKCSLLRANAYLSHLKAGLINYSMRFSAGIFV